ncbi:hypothetical protein [Microcoleus sp. BROC3]|uniref:hypothetical protein n=1 Tax=Microcoleus sp. BROC3 TaxID=3055323 RepID=UPI002FCE8A5C
MRDRLIRYRRQVGPQADRSIFGTLRSQNPASAGHKTLGNAPVSGCGVSYLIANRKLTDSGSAPGLPLWSQFFNI